MPYNTRRKSLSLPSLGIHVPISNAARAAALANRHAQAQAQSHTTSGSASPSSSSVAHSASSLSSLSTSSSASSPTFSPRSPTDRDRDRDRDSMNLAAEAQTSSARKIKRSRTADDRERSAPAAKRRQTDANTPPPSPGSRNPSRAISIEMDDVDDNGYDSAASDVGPEIDMSSINDEIVEAVIVQLQATRNRPHIVKELAAVLMGQLKIVQQSANPAAIISSRLSGYLKRSCWNAKNPCPMAKELETVHPRRTYFYLTTTPHQPLPDTAHASKASRAELPTPSATSVSENEDDDRRRELSPSPEVDLSAPEFDDVDDDDVPMPGTPIGSYPGRMLAIVQRPGGRANSPPLEKDEKEFTQTADGLQKRKLSGGLLSLRVEPLVEERQQSTDAMVPSDEHGAKDETLFGGLKASAATPANGGHHVPSMVLLASPAIRPLSLDLKKEKESDGVVWAQLDSQLDWDRSPETVELDELDRMLTGF